jgi:citrate synthase
VLDRYIQEHGKIIPGFGHRFHGVDPRAVKLLSLVDREAEAGTVVGLFRHIGRAVEESLSRRKQVPIPMNIDGATAVIYSELGFPAELGRGLFVLSRSVGILAHAWEQRQQGGRIKGPMPTSIPFNYAGPPEREFKPRTE